MVSLDQKRLEIIKDTVPKLNRVAVLWNPPNAARENRFKELEAAASALGVSLQILSFEALKISRAHLERRSAGAPER